MKLIKYVLRFCLIILGGFIIYRSIHIFILFQFYDFDLIGGDVFFGVIGASIALILVGGILSIMAYFIGEGVKWVFSK